MRWHYRMMKIIIMRILGISVIHISGRSGCLGIAVHMAFIKKWSSQLSDTSSHAFTSRRVMNTSEAHDLPFLPFSLGSPSSSKSPKRLPTQFLSGIKNPV